ncbi:MAG TPA: hypothetical protein ENK18_05850 [Deltaproteobacteria bacterium]|nr:hypothetical protein [Deltaproteobacteria bacterium]
MTPATALERIRAADAALSASGATPFPLPIGELLPVVAGTVSALSRGDWWVPGLRERAGAVVRDVPLERLIDGLAGARPYRVAPPSPDGALRALYAVGLALSDPQRAAVVHLGLGSMGDGAAHEALNLAALLEANVVFVVAVHPLGDGAPLGRQLATSPAALAAGLGVAVTEVDGSDAEAVAGAVADARSQPGPHLVVARLP